MFILLTTYTHSLRCIHTHIHLCIYTHTHTHTLPITEITPAYVEQLIRSKHFKTCIYIDNITPYLLKRNLNFFCLSYTDLINKCIQHSNFPLILKHSIITPILKKPSLDKSLPENYRPISNLSFLSKIIKK